VTAGPFFAEVNTYTRVAGHWLPRGVHLWAGPVGLHVCWPDLWNSRFDHCPAWRQPV